MSLLNRLLPLFACVAFGTVATSARSAIPEEVQKDGRKWLPESTAGQ